MSDASANTPAAGLPPGIRWASWAGLMTVATLICVMLATSAGNDTAPGPVVGVAFVGAALLIDAWPAWLWLVAAIGLGGFVTRLAPDASDRMALRIGGGIALMLTLTFAVGSMTLAPTAMWLLVLAGLTLGVWDCRGGVRLGDRPSGWWWLAAPGAGVLLVAATSAPGWLWDTEFGGYDVLSYHLQLVQEWLEAGRVRTFEHNVYSFLPSYIEAAFAHVGVLGGAAGPAAGERVWGVVEHNGRGMIQAQALHAGITLVAAWMSARTTRAACASCGLTGRGAYAGAALAGVLVLVTPWTVVVGSLAYNEMAVVLLGAAALGVAFDRNLSPRVRGLIAGGLVGVACGAKPTALLFVAPVVGAVILVLDRPKIALRVVRWCCVAGIATLLPWLVRNGIASGNPVFPHAASLFGTGHWSAEQVARYASGHAFDGSWFDRVMLLIAKDDLGRVRGFTHIQWGLLSLVVLWCGISAIAQRATRRVGTAVSLGVLALVLAWLALTHIQSRFLLPIVLPAAVLFGLTIAAGRSRGGSRGFASVGAALVALGVQVAALGWVWLGQRGGAPAAALAGWAGVMSGERLAADSVLASPWSALNYAPDIAGERTLMVGDAAVLYACGDIIYHTTWDTSPIGEAIREHGADDYEQITDAMRELGVAFVLVNVSELDRLHESGWYDPDVTVERVRAWLIASGERVMIWPGRELWRLR